MKYRIDLVQTVTEGATVFVEAATEEEAEAQVLDMLDDGHSIAEGRIDWKFVEVEQDAEIIGLEPVQDRGPPEGVEIVSLEDPAAMHRAIGRAVGEE
jgi:hypothetical protein